MRHNHAYDTRSNTHKPPHTHEHTKSSYTCDHTQMNTHNPEHNFERPEIHSHTQSTHIRRHIRPPLSPLSNHAPRNLPNAGNAVTHPVATIDTHHCITTQRNFNTPNPKRPNKKESAHIYAAHIKHKGPIRRGPLQNPQTTNLDITGNPHPPKKSPIDILDPKHLVTNLP
jgi:hypothetical protein